MHTHVTRHVTAVSPRACYSPFVVARPKRMRSPHLFEVKKSKLEQFWHPLAWGPKNTSDLGNTPNRGACPLSLSASRGLWKRLPAHSPRQNQEMEANYIGFRDPQRNIKIRSPRTIWELYKDYIGVIMVHIGDLIFRSSQGSGGLYRDM